WNIFDHMMPNATSATKVTPYSFDLAGFHNHFCLQVVLENQDVRNPQLSGYFRATQTGPIYQATSRNLVAEAQTLGRKRAPRRVGLYRYHSIRKFGARHLDRIHYRLTGSHFGIDSRQGGLNLRGIILHADMKLPIDLEHVVSDSRRIVVHH